jgi:hypothetical protein
MFAQYALPTPATSLFTKRLMATATLGAKKGLLSAFGVTAAVATVLLLAPSEEFDDLDCLNHTGIYMDDCEHYKHPRK